MYKSILYFSFIVFAFLFAADNLDAKKTYKYKDENGLWHFTDRPPATDQPVEVEQVYVSGNEKKVLVESRGSRYEPYIHVHNLYRGPVEMVFEAISTENAAFTPPLPISVVIPAMTEVDLFSIKAVQKNKRWAYRFRHSYVPGKPDAVHKPEKPYRPPIERGVTFLLSQAFGGDYSHNDPWNQYAVDIAMPEGSPVYAARGGIIMDIARDFYTGGSDMEKYGERANYVRILHDDGTMAVYAHLKLESVRYGLGRRIEEGAFIAESGSTGFSSGPHLHFVIQRNTGMAIESLPFQFEGEGGRAYTPEKGMVLEVLM
ncbi:MAG: M23 family metallopeptidase [Deltaproteobacteria bacterium]|nr:M23 family metallopeptidase [Deltaproteobacteria bacterium]